MQQIIKLQDIKTTKDIYQSIQQECLKREYSFKTIKSYISWAKLYLKYTKTRCGRYNVRDFYLKDFITDLAINKKQKPTSRNCAVWALKFLFEVCLQKKIPENEFPVLAKIPSTMPNILTKEQIRRMIDSVDCSTKAFTLKHRLYIEIPYSAGLRLAETIGLRVYDIDFKNNFIFVRNGKGNKDRSAKLAEQTKQDIIQYLKIRENQSNPYLFDKGLNYHISGRTIWKVLKRQAKLCNIAQRVHPHILRDSYATHLLWDGYDIRFIQQFLGHAKLNTTQKYTRVSDPQLKKIPSPLDLP